MLGTRTIAATSVLAALAVLSAPGASSGFTGVADRPWPTLTLQRDCRSYPSSHAIRIILAGFPPNADVSGSVELPGSGEVRATVRTDPEGEYAIGVGSQVPGTFTVQGRWRGKGLAVSLAVTCGRPAQQYCAARSLSKPGRVRALGTIRHHPHERQHCQAAKARRA